MENKIKALKVKLGLNFPELLPIIYRVDVVPMPKDVEERAKRITPEVLACTDGDKIFIHENFFKLSQNDQVFVFLHELIHILLIHPFRAHNKDPFIWNIASDGVSNKVVEELGFKTDLDGIRINDLKKINSSISEQDSCETIYLKLIEKASKCGGNGKGKSKGSGKNGSDVFGDVKNKPWDHVLPSERKLNEVEKQERLLRLREVIEAMRNRGKNPGSLELEFERLSTKRRLPKKELSEVIRKSFGNDFTNILNPKKYWEFKQRKIFYPLMEDTTPGKLIIVIDSSGSTSDYWKDFLTEVFNVCRDKVEVILIQIDAKIQDVSRIKTVPKKLALKGGGGTDFKEFFKLKWIEKLKPKMSIKELKKIPVFFFTDLNAYNVPNKCPKEFDEKKFYWVLIEDVKIPFGKEIPWYILSNKNFD